MSEPTKNNLAKATNLFLKAIGVRKADVPMETPAEPDGAGQPNKDALVDECLGMLDDGSLTADPESVQEWATSKGMSPEEAADFAEAILTDYFNTGEGDETEKAEMPPLPEEEEPAGEEEVEKSVKALTFFMGQISKRLDSLSTLEKNLEVITKGMTSLYQANTELLDSNNLMKASLERLGFTPVSKAKPVTQAQEAIVSSIATMPFAKKKEIVMNGILKGNLKASPSEVNLFESSLGKSMTANIENFIKENNKDGK